MEPRPDTMRAVGVDRFGGPDELRLLTLPVPTPDPHEVLLRVEVAGVGQWDPFEREGGYAEMQGTEPAFPYVLGSEGAGVVAAVGDEVDPDRFAEGDRVFAAGFLNPKGGFYAEHVAVDADLVAPLPRQLSTEQAGVFSGVAVTALRGLDDTLELKPGETLVVVGASGGLGHVAVQLARRLGARVLAVASGDDGVALARRLGAEAVVDGRTGDVEAAVRAFAPDGADAALLATGGEVADQVVRGMRAGGRVAYPSGVFPVPEPDAHPGVDVDIRDYNGLPDREIIGRLLGLIGDESFDVQVARTFPLEQVADAHAALEDHHLGKLALRVA